MVRMVVCRVILLIDTACLLIPNIGYGNCVGYVGNRNTYQRDYNKSILHSNLFLNVPMVGAKARHLNMFNLFCIL